MSREKPKNSFPKSNTQDSRKKDDYEDLNRETVSTIKISVFARAFPHILRSKIPLFSSCFWQWISYHNKTSPQAKNIRIRAVLTYSSNIRSCECKLAQLTLLIYRYHKHFLWKTILTTVFVFAKVCWRRGISRRVFSWRLYWIDARFSALYLSMHYEERLWYRCDLHILLISFFLIDDSISEDFPLKLWVWFWV